MTTVTGYCSLQATNSWLQSTSYCSLWLQLLVAVLFKQPVHDYSHWLLFSSSNQFMTTVTGYCSLQATSSWLQSLATVLFKQPIHGYSPLANVLFDYSYWLLFSSSNQFMTTVTGYCFLQATSTWLQSLATVLFDYSYWLLFSSSNQFMTTVTGYCSLQATSSWLQSLATVLFKQPVHDYSHWLLFSSSNQFMATVH